MSTAALAEVAEADAVRALAGDHSAAERLTAMAGAGRNVGGRIEAARASATPSRAATATAFEDAVRHERAGAPLEGGHAGSHQAEQRREDERTTHLIRLDAETHEHAPEDEGVRYKSGRSRTAEVFGKHMAKYVGKPVTGKMDMVLRGAEFMGKMTVASVGDYGERVGSMGAMDGAKTMLGDAGSLILTGVVTLTKPRNIGRVIGGLSYALAIPTFGGSILIQQVARRAVFKAGSLLVKNSAAISARLMKSNIPGAKMLGTGVSKLGNAGKWMRGLDEGMRDVDRVLTRGFVSGTGDAITTLATGVLTRKGIGASLKASGSAFTREIKTVHNSRGVTGWIADAPGKVLKTVKTAAVGVIDTPRVVVLSVKLGKTQAERAIAQAARNTAGNYSKGVIYGTWRLGLGTTRIGLKTAHAVLKPMLPLMAATATVAGSSVSAGMSAIDASKVEGASIGQGAASLERETRNAIKGLGGNVMTRGKAALKRNGGGSTEERAASRAPQIGRKKTKKSSGRNR